MIPLGGHPADPNYSLTHFIRKGFYFTSDLAHAEHGSVTGKIKIPQQAAGVIWICGERGIRTPGSPEGEQRFSRPPHSTTLPSLQYQLIIYVQNKFRIFNETRSPTAAAGKNNKILTTDGLIDGIKETFLKSLPPSKH